MKTLLVVYHSMTGATEQIFTNPENSLTQGYITGRFG